MADKAVGERKAEKAKIAWRRFLNYDLPSGQLRRRLASGIAGASREGEMRGPGRHGGCLQAVWVHLPWRARSQEGSATTLWHCVEALAGERLRQCAECLSRDPAVPIR